MSADHWPITMPFDPGAGLLPAPLEELWSSGGGGGHLLLLSSGDAAQRDGWAPRSAIALAEALAVAGVQVLLTDLGVAEPRLHLEGAGEDVEGIVDIFHFGASLRRVMRPVPEHGYNFLPRGAYVPDPAAFLADPGWKQLLTQLADEGLTLLAHLPAETPGAESLAGHFERVIVLGDPDEVEATRPLTTSAHFRLLLHPLLDGEESEPTPAGATALEPETGTEELAGVEREEGGASERSESDEAADAPLHEPPPLPRARRRQRRVSPILWLLLLIVAGAGVWSVLRDRGLLPDWLTLIELLGSDHEVEVVLEPAAELAEKAGAPAAVKGEPVETPLPYSVAVEAHQNYSTAAERVQWLRHNEPGISFYISPIEYQGVVYYRVLAGTAADTAGAWRLMERLVDARRKTDLDPWSIRPTVWAFHLGDYDSEVEAAERMVELDGLQIPTYLVEIEYTEGPSRYRIYAGAFEGPAPAELMAPALKEAGIDAQLVRRYGKPSQ